MIKDFKSFVFVSVDVKGVAGAFFVSVDVKGLRPRERSLDSPRSLGTTILAFGDGLSGGPFLRRVPSSFPAIATEVRIPQVTSDCQGLIWLPGASRAGVIMADWPNKSWNRDSLGLGEFSL